MNITYNRAFQSRDKTMSCRILTCLFIFAFVWATILALPEGSDFENSIVVSSLKKSIFPVISDHINMFPGTLYDFKTTYSYFGLKNFDTRILSLDVDYSRKRLYIFDSNTGAIFKIENFNWENSFSNISISITHDGVSRASTRISIDWVADNIYWTDQLFGWIAVQSASKQYVYKIIVKDELEKPYALAVSPVHKFLYWSDVGSTVKIERASLSGSNKETIISTGLALPTSIDIDYAANKIVWVDAVRDTVETANLDGTARRVIRRMAHSEFYDVAVFRDIICVTDLSNGSLKLFNKNMGAVLNSITKNSGDPFVAVTLYSADAQPHQEDLCKDKGCSDICIHESSGPSCLCKEGFKLKLDGLSCEEDLGKFHRALMWTNATDICMIDIRSLSSSGHNDHVECLYKVGTSISHFDIDMSERNMAFVDGREIYSTKIGQALTKTRLITTNEKITGIALDWRDNNVYWCMGETKGSISILSQSTLGSFPLVDTNLTYPKDLNLLPFHNLMFWISGTTGAHRIERSELSGSKRQSLISGGSLGNPNSLIVDSSSYTLYFIDSGFVKSCDIDGNGLKILKPSKPLNSPKSLLTYKNHLIVSDSNYPTSVLKIFEKTTTPAYKYQLSAFDVDSMTDMKVLDDLLQPTEIGPCAILNGDCEHICIPIGRNRLCRCEYGFILDPNKETCSSTAVDDDFLLVTDWTHNQIYQISLATDDVRAVDTDTHGSPVAIIYNEKTQQVIWSSGGLVHSIGLNGTGYKVLLNTEMFGSFADRFSIDYSTGKVYYTANPILPTGFTGIGVISSEGLHKRLISFGEKPRAIVLDPEEGLLFWTDHATTPAFVKKANMDGSNIQTVVQSGLVWPNGLAIDTEANELYVTDGLTNAIHRCSYVGVCTEYYVDSEAHLMDIELLGDFLYYTAWNRPYITKLHKKDPGVISRVGYKPELGRLDSISLYNSTMLLPVVTGCSSNNGRGPCSTFCLPTPSGYTCACEDGVNLLNDGKTCENAKTTTTTTTLKPSTTFPSSLTLKPSKPVSSPLTSKDVTTTTTEKTEGVQVAVIAGVIAGIIVLVAIIATLVFFIVKRINKKNSTNGQGSNQHDSGFDISFINPASIQQQRPDTTYDLITFDDPKSEDSGLNKSTIDNDYTSLIKQNEYEKLSVLRNSNEYHKMSSTARPESSQTQDDYLVPVSGTRNNSNDEDFNDPTYRGDTAVENNNPFLNSPNQVSTISYTQQK